MPWKSPDHKSQVSKNVAGGGIKKSWVGEEKDRISSKVKAGYL